MAGKQIVTHSKVRKLQRTLYQQARSNPQWKAWSLYADLCRKEFIEEAMSRVLRNRGGSGVDGYTVGQMNDDWETFRDNLQCELQAKTYKSSAVLRVEIPKDNGGTRKLGIPTVKDRVVQTILVILLEPIFEADFHDESYGYRPQRNAKQAIGSIREGVRKGKTVAIEADLTQYFDTIDHKRLLKLVRKRVSDGSILKLIKQCLRAPAVEEEQGGKGKSPKRRVLSSKEKGTPQGGVISPMLANLYLDRLDKAVNELDPYRIKMVRYADDFVILVRPGLEEELLQRVKHWLEQAGLQLNEEKTKTTYTRKKGKIEFLGFEVSERKSTRTGRPYIHVQPNKKSEMKYRDKVRKELNRWTTWRDTEDAIKRINRITKGWGNYFDCHCSYLSFKSQNYWLKRRVRRWLAEKHKTRGRSLHKTYPDTRLEQEGLHLLSEKCAWG